MNKKKRTVDEAFKALEERESRFANWSRTIKDAAVENAELKVRVAKLEQKKSQTDEKNNFIVKSDDDAKIISLEDKMIDETLDEAHKKRDVSSDLSHNKETVKTVNDQDPKLSHDTETVNDQDLRLPRGEKTIANIIDEQV
ncbi:16222_t:CDS:2 [Acaulospora colombiana]|uniref:16222_t:CDS:1 n=1 Tax=Acaulospora colombiana TaxID=27376 RepID=A0ACA9MBL6_9GLOM|nr:16222_t:CDS:2 [Acaulospora colombiana]